MLPQMMPGMPAFWAPAGPQPRRLTWGRARARQKARKPTEKSKDRAAREPATAKAKRTEQQPTTQHSSFRRYVQRFVEQGPSVAGMPGSAWRQNARK